MAVKLGLAEKPSVLPAPPAVPLPPPTPLHEVSYEDVADLLTLPGRWRSGMVQRFEVRADDQEFRKALDRNLSRHREWDPILHPEKYVLPDQSPAPAEPNRGRRADKEKSR